MFCVKCGYELQNITEVCSKCGYLNEPLKKAEQGVGYGLVKILGIGVILIVIMLLFISGLLLAIH